MSDERKLTLSDKPSAPGPKPAEAGKPRMSFGSRRSKPVVVERKRRKFLRKDGDQGPAKPVVEENFSLKPKKPAAEVKEREEESKLTSTERDARVEALQEAIRQAEEERMRAAEEKRQRDAEAQKNKAKTEKHQTGTTKEEDAKRKAEEDAKRHAEEENRKKTEAEAAAQQALEAEEKQKATERSKEAARKEKLAEEDREQKKELEKKRHANLKKIGGELRIEPRSGAGTKATLTAPILAS